MGVKSALNFYGGGLIKDIFDAVDGKVRALGCETVDVEQRSEYGQTVITVFVDKVPDGVSLNDCEELHYAVEPILDELDPTNGKPYVLEISSPGLDRPFKTQRDFERNYGKKTEVKLFAPLKGQKTYEGVLVERTDGYLVLEQKGELVKIENTRIAVARPLVKFD